MSRELRGSDQSMDRAPIAQLDEPRGDPATLNAAATLIMDRNAAPAEPYTELLRSRFGDRNVGGGRYGQAPDYRKITREQRPISARYREVLPKVAAFIGSKIDELVPAEERFSVSEAEIETTFLAEGGDQVLHQQQESAMPQGVTGPILEYLMTLDGANNKTLEAQYRTKFQESLARLQKDREFSHQLKWMHPSIFAPDADHPEATQLMGIERNVYALAAGYAMCKAEAAHDYQRLKGGALRDLTETTQLFWVSIYFSAGRFTGAKLMKAHDGPEDGSWDTTARIPKNYEQQRTPSYMANPYFYGVRRAASMELLRKQEK